MAWSSDSPRCVVLPGRQSAFMEIDRVGIRKSLVPGNLAREEADRESIGDRRAREMLFKGRQSGKQSGDARCT